jgi:hypothetical protein
LDLACNKKYVTKKAIRVAGSLFLYMQQIIFLIRSRFVLRSDAVPDR